MPASKKALNGAGRRKLDSWIESFVEYGEEINLESAKLYRKWSAIGAVAAALEQKVWLTTSSRLYPNLYTVLVGSAGTGKTRSIMLAREFLAKLDKFYLAPKDNPSWAALADALYAARRDLVDLSGQKPPVTYHSMTIIADELTAFMADYESKIIGGLTTVYDVMVPYEEWKRGKELRLHIPSPQLNILAGSTPSNLLRFIPDYAWEQGFTSRLLLIYANERIIGDDFAKQREGLPLAMTHDLEMIYNLQGEFNVSPEFREAVNGWRATGELGQLQHPKLVHYNSRRRAHLYKLSMVSAIDRGNDLQLLAEDFHRAREWLTEAEREMPKIFEAGIVHADSLGMDELVAWIARQKKPVPHYTIVRRASRLFPNYSVMKVFDLLVLSGQIMKIGEDEKGYPLYLSSPTDSSSTT